MRTKSKVKSVSKRKIRTRVSKTFKGYKPSACPVNFTISVGSGGGGGGTNMRSKHYKYSSFGKYEEQIDNIYFEIGYHVVLGLALGMTVLALVNFAQVCLEFFK